MMNTAEKKAAASGDALERSQQAPRRTSSASTQNELTASAPALYQVTKINVPASLGEVGKLIHSECTKIQQSQTIILSLWQQQQEAKTEIARLRGALEVAGIGIPD